MSDIEKTTPRPWVVRVVDDNVRPRVFVTREFGVDVPPKFYVAFMPDGPGDSEADAKLIVSAVNEYETLCQDWQAEVEGRLALRKEHGARDDETFPAFVGRLRQERDDAVKAKEEAERRVDCGPDRTCESLGEGMCRRHQMALNDRLVTRMEQVESRAAALAQENAELVEQRDRETSARRDAVVRAAALEEGIGRMKGAATDLLACLSSKPTTEAGWTERLMDCAEDLRDAILSPQQAGKGEAPPMDDADAIEQGIEIGMADVEDP